jgi:hypothetical protein
MPHPICCSEKNLLSQGTDGARHSLCCFGMAWRENVHQSCKGGIHNEVLHELHPCELQPIKQSPDKCLRSPQKAPSAHKHSPCGLQQKPCRTAVPPTPRSSACELEKRENASWKRQQQFALHRNAFKIHGCVRGIPLRCKCL